MPEISVIISAYNEEKRIVSALESIKRQKADKEIIVVDGGSTDNTVNVARRYGKVVTQRGKGISNARNTGARHAKGRILYFLDADTVLYDGALEAVSSSFKDEGVVGATGPIYPLEKVKWGISLLYRVNYTTMVKMSIALGKPSFIGSNLAIRADTFRKVHGFNERMKTYEDCDLTIRAGKYGRMAFSGGIRARSSARRMMDWGMGRYLGFTTRNLVNYYLFKRSRTDYEHIR